MKPILFASLFAIYACHDAKKPAEPQVPDQSHPPLSKPGASNNDTLQIDHATVVFFSPDSLQVQKIKSVTKEGVFESTMHEYFYQIRNGHIYLGKNWPQLEIVDTKNSRFLLFRNKNGINTLIDLDTKDPAGMFLFDGIQEPRLADMMNVDTEVPNYFKNSISGKDHVSK